MASSSARPVDRRSNCDASTESAEPDPLFEGTKLMTSPNYLRRFVVWLQERRS